MKKTIFGLWAVLMAGMFGSCNEVKTPDDGVEHLAWDSIVKDTTVMLCDEADSPSAEIHLNIKYADGKHAQAVNDSLLRSGILTPDYLSLEEKDKKMNVAEAVKLFVDSYMADYKENFGELYGRDPEHSASYSLQYSCQTDVMDRGNIISYVAQVYNYAGGAHGMNFTIVKNIDAKTGKIMKLGDVFVPGYEEKTKELILEKMLKKFEAKDLEGLREKGIFNGIEPYVPTNFILGDDEVEFIYCDTEIAPHAVGEIRIAVPRRQLDDLLKKTE